MTFVKGKRYGRWVFVEHGKSKRRYSCCHLCGKFRKEWYRFERYTPKGRMINHTELGTECVNQFDFNQTNPYTDKHGVNRAK